MSPGRTKEGNGAIFRYEKLPKPRTVSTKEYCKHRINWAFIPGVNLLPPLKLHSYCASAASSFQSPLTSHPYGFGELLMSFVYIRSDETSQDFLVLNSPVCFLLF